MHAELRLDHGVAVGRMQDAGSCARLNWIGCHQCRQVEDPRRPKATRRRTWFTARAAGRGVDRGHHLSPNRQDFLYPVAVLHWFSRRVGGWAMAKHMQTELVIDVLACGAGTDIGMLAPPRTRLCIGAAKRCGLMVIEPRQEVAKESV